MPSDVVSGVGLGRGVLDFGEDRPIPLLAIHVIGPSWKMLNQPPVSPSTLAVTENYEICCHIISDFKAKMHQIVCQLGLSPRLHIYSVHFVYLYVLCNWTLAPLLQNRSSAHGHASQTYFYTVYGNEA